MFQQHYHYRNRAKDFVHDTMDEFCTRIWTQNELEYELKSRYDWFLEYRNAMLQCVVMEAKTRIDRMSDVIANINGKAIYTSNWNHVLMEVQIQLPAKATLRKNDVIRLKNWDDQRGIVYDVDKTKNVVRVFIKQGDMVRHSKVSILLVGDIFSDVIQFQTLLRVNSLPEYLRFPFFGSRELWKKYRPDVSINYKLLQTKYSGTYHHFSEEFLEWIHKNFNPSQQNAIVQAYKGRSRYTVIHGPPGTGKTTSLRGIVSALLQRGEGNVLITAQSNSAVDEIMRNFAIGKLFIGKKETSPHMIRFGRVEGMALDVSKYYIDNLIDNEYRQQITPTKPPPMTLAQLKLYGKGGLPQKKKLTKAEIELSIFERCQLYFATLSSSIRTMNNVKFSTCIIDEGSQATEPECLIPIVKHCGTLQRVIIVGDHRQLPPTIFNDKLSRSKYQCSLMERMLSRKHPKVFLSIQYRMHPSIVHFPNVSFYHKQLTTDPSVEKRGQKYYKLGLRPYYVIDNSEGKEKESRNGSKENRKEIESILLILTYLEKKMKFLFSSLDIGIITPYLGQVWSLKRSLQKFPRVEISSVDSFQGREKDIVILSLVRTEKVGFLDETRRLNVAMTRAKHSFFLVGNLSYLSENSVIFKRLFRDARKRDVVVDHDYLRRLGKDKNAKKDTGGKGLELAKSIGGDDRDKPYIQDKLGKGLMDANGLKRVVKSNLVMKDKSGLGMKNAGKEAVNKEMMEDDVIKVDYNRVRSAIKSGRISFRDNNRLIKSTVSKPSIVIKKKNPRRQEFSKIKEDEQKKNAEQTDDNPGIKILNKPMKNPRQQGQPGDGTTEVKNKAFPTSEDRVFPTREDAFPTTERVKTFSMKTKGVQFSTKEDEQKKNEDYNGGIKFFDTMQHYPSYAHPIISQGIICELE